MTIGVILFLTMTGASLIVLRSKALINVLGCRVVDRTKQKHPVSKG